MVWVWAGRRSGRTAAFQETLPAPGALMSTPSLHRVPIGFHTTNPSFNTTTEQECEHTQYTRQGNKGKHLPRPDIANNIDESDHRMAFLCTPKWSDLGEVSTSHLRRHLPHSGQNSFPMFYNDAFFPGFFKVQAYIY